MAASSCVHEPLQETDRTSSSAVPRMEPLWSPVVANGGNRGQIEESRKPQKQAKTVATGCHPLPEKFHGKEERCAPLAAASQRPPLSLGGRRSISLKRQVLRTRRPTGLDRATLA